MLVVIKKLFYIFDFFFNELKLRIKENELIDEKEQELGHSMAGYACINDLKEKRAKRIRQFKDTLNSIA